MVSHQHTKLGNSANYLCGRRCLALLRSRRLRQAGNQVLDRFFQTRNALPGEQLHAGCALELRQFLLEREQAQAAGSKIGGIHINLRALVPLGWTRALRFYLRNGWLLDQERCRRGWIRFQSTARLMRCRRVLRVKLLIPLGRGR